MAGGMWNTWGEVSIDLYNRKWRYKHTFLKKSNQKKKKNLTVPKPSALTLIPQNLWTDLSTVNHLEENTQSDWGYMACALTGKK